MSTDVDWTTARRKAWAKRRQRLEKAHQRYQLAAERVIADKAPSSKRTEWMHDEFGNPWRQIGDLEGTI